MFDVHRGAMHSAYQTARAHFLAHREELIAVEKLLHETVFGILSEHVEAFRKDYDEASFLYPFWQNYPPEERGRAPRGDQFPWIEVGEHSIGCKLARYLGEHFKLRDVGLPAGTDQRFVVQSKEIKERLHISDAAMLFIDIKSVGPRDDFKHTVLSPFQVSGDGWWEDVEVGVKNTPLTAQGSRSSHEFHCALPPLYVLSDGTVVPCVSLFLKPVYQMLSLNEEVRLELAVAQGTTDEPPDDDPLPRTEHGDEASKQVGKILAKGQPLRRFTLATLPNGLLLAGETGYLRRFPGLFFPGKDDTTVKAKNRRARISFQILEAIALWRVSSLAVPTSDP